jgi:hypothetical protein
MPGLEPAPDDAASGRTFTENLRRFFRREPDMGDDPVDFAAVSAICLFLTVPAVILGAVQVWLVSPASPSFVTMMMAMAPVVFHFNGPRHRWWALGAAAVVGVVAGRGIDAVLYDILGRDWAALAGYICGGWIAAHVYAAVTHLPRRRAIS